MKLVSWNDFKEHPVATSIIVGIIIAVIWGMSDSGGVGEQSSSYSSSSSSYSSDSSSYSRSAEPQVEEEPQISESDFKNSCIDVGSNSSYRELLRNPQGYYGRMVCLQVKLDNTNLGGGYMSAYTQEPEFGTWMGDQYVLYDSRSGGLRLISEDIVNVYGYARGVEQFTTISGTVIDAPVIEIVYADILNQ